MSSVDTARIEAAITEIICAIGENPEREGLRETPRRVAQAYAEFFSGMDADPSVLLAETFPAASSSNNEPVLMRALEFRSICEHHFLPFFGRAHIAYIPTNRIVGLGRIPAVLEVVAARPQLQERLGEEVAQILCQGLDAAGVLVVLEATHGCVRARGSRQHASSTVTIASTGLLHEPAARAELMSLIGLSDAH